MVKNSRPKQGGNEMNYCHVCDNPKNDLSKCEECNQDVCVECCVEYNPHNMIDFSFCKSCEELGE